MITWIRENAALFSLATALVVFISGAAVGWHQLDGVVGNQVITDAHIHDSTRHLDPIRDAEMHKRLEERINKLEERLRELESRRARWGGREGSWRDRDRRSR